MTDHRTPASAPADGPQPARITAQQVSDAIFERTGWRTSIVFQSVDTYHHKMLFSPAFHQDYEFTWMCDPYEITVTQFYLDENGFPARAFVTQGIAHFAQEAEKHTRAD
jgi:hypothetical protein